MVQENYEVKGDGYNEAEVLLYSDWECFGGRTSVDSTIVSFDRNSIKCSLNPFSALIMLLK